MIKELLGTGKDSAQTGADLAAVLGVDIRTVTERIEQERRNGAPICATSNGAAAGYYLAADQAELDDYAGRLWHRIGELHKTRRALKKARDKLPAADDRQGAV